MYGFEQHIAANRTNTFLLMLGFLVFIGALGYLTGYLIDPAIANVVLIGCVIVAVFATGISYWSSDSIITRMVNARPANPLDYKEKFFIDSVEGLVLACGLPAIPKAYVIESEAMNAFATGRDPQHSIICVTTGLLVLDRQELEGVIAHEMSHVYNRDILLMGVAAVLVGGIAMFCHLILRIMLYGGGGGGRSKSDRDSGGCGPWGMIIALAFIILAPIFANLMNLMISRKREFLADATAVKLTRNPEGLQQALARISASPAKMPFVETELSALFIDHPQKVEAGAGWFATLFATHPPIAERIAALKNM